MATRHERALEWVGAFSPFLILAVFLFLTMGEDDSENKGILPDPKNPHG
ncbi:MAG: hypothetical protein AAB439_01195 [Patescibacteria group bacterium]